MRLACGLSITALLGHHAFAQFSLDTFSSNWHYTSSSLLNTTTQSCKTAYSASIDCSPTLLALVNPAPSKFEPTAQDLDNTCSTTCKSSLEDYVTSVGMACKQNGDLAQETVGNNGTYTYDKVWAVGNFFEYVFAQACSKDTQNNYCHNTTTTTTFATAPANCTSECSTNFYQNAHTFAPASHLQIQHYRLASQSEAWIGQFKTGYAAIKACGLAASRTNSAMVPDQTGEVGGSGGGGGGKPRESVTSVVAGSTTATASSGGTAPTANSTVVTSPKSEGGVPGVDLLGVLFLGAAGLLAVSYL